MAVDQDFSAGKTMVGQLPLSQF